MVRYLLQNEHGEAKTLDSYNEKLPNSIEMPTESYPKMTEMRDENPR